MRAVLQESKARWNREMGWRSAAKLLERPAQPREVVG